MIFSSRFSGSACLVAARVFTLGFAIGATVPAGALSPEAYFAGAAGLEGTTLKNTLESVIDGHRRISYSAAENAHRDLYEDPNDSSRMILFYSQASWDKDADDPGFGSAEYWNREHLWPRSYGVGDSGDDNSDLFHLVPANKYINSIRGNKFFDVSNPADASYKDPPSSLVPECSSDSNSWEPGDGQKGWVARAMFYMTTRYDYLELVDTPPFPASDDTLMAQLSVLLDWNRKFLPATKEKEVNQRIYDDYQLNRNPYIDYPEFADAVWVGHPSWGSWRLEHFTLAELLNPAISGDDADPDKDGLANIVEMARYSNPRIRDARPAVEGSISGNAVTLSFRRADSTGNLNLQVVLEVSTNLTSWDPVDLGSAGINPAGPYQEEVVITRNVNAGEIEFYRLRVERP